MSWNLYLDDERTPKTSRDWVVIRNSDDFLSALQERGLPTVVSLDHDLGMESENGYWCTKHLVAQWMNLGVDLSQIEFNVHSANPVGARNMREHFEGSVRAQKRFGIAFFVEGD